LLPWDGHLCAAGWVQQCVSLWLVVLPLVSAEVVPVGIGGVSGLGLVVSHGLGLGGGVEGEEGCDHEGGDDDEQGGHGVLLRCRCWFNRIMWFGCCLCVLVFVCGFI